MTSREEVGTSSQALKAAMSCDRMSLPGCDSRYSYGPLRIVSFSTPQLSPLERNRCAFKGGDLDKLSRRENLLLSILLPAGLALLGPANHSRSSNWGNRRRSSAIPPRLLYLRGACGLPPTTVAAALSLLERRGGIDNEPKLMLETELELGVCDKRGVDFEAVAGDDADAITRVEAEWLNGFVVVVVEEEEELVVLGVRLGVDVELRLMAVFVSDMTSIGLLIRAAVATVAPFVVRESE